jgi:hypothetical protein
MNRTRPQIAPSSAEIATATERAATSYVLGSRLKNRGPQLGCAIIPEINLATCSFPSTAEIFQPDAPSQPLAA